MSKLEKTALQMALLTCAEAAELLGVKEPTVRVWIARKKLGHTKLGRSCGSRKTLLKSLFVRMCRRSS